MACIKECNVSSDEDEIRSPNSAGDFDQDCDKAPALLDTNQRWMC